ncbi:hypothetical protein PRZ48_003511 [Zasmidium cellare]|uniref:SMAD/FHA domain-containing protein n=1 Tax=Zasmidium cellare TaxID=395010 RepID=A0ABR0EWJ2_ZASCE|nr:hypothetical protein PRZ48_003511 [Zasmidium cellare]
MLNSAQPTPSSLYAAATTSTTPTSPSRPSRLRGLSYLRSYTHNHLHSSRSEPPTLTRSTSSPGIASPTATTSTATPTPIAQQTIPERGSQSAIQSVEGGWIPRSGLIRESAQPTTTSTPASPEPVSTSTMMTRSRTASSSLGPTPTVTAVHPAQRRQPAFETTPTSDPFTMPAHSTSAPTTAPTAAGPSKDQLPTIRFIPHVETRSSRPSLQFTALSRTLKNPTAVVRVGRYSERDNHTGDPNTLPVGFKSKVVSRRHCEFWCTEGQWYIKDVKSSSGTFLNHVRLSSPGVESRPYPVNDGDVVQLGIDFKGGEELIFRCVKIRVECNRGWQKSLNSFNTAAHKRLFKSALKTRNRDSDAASVNSSECSICLNPVAPCQALFVAPCSHVWHYKCVRNLIHGPQWPNFVCPNCRFVADLDADVEQPEDEEYLYDEEAQRSTEHVNGGVEAGASDEMSPSDGDDRSDTPPPTGNVSRDDDLDDELAELLNETSLGTPSPNLQAGDSSEAVASRSSSTSRPIRIAQPASASRVPSDPLGARSMTPTSHAQFALAVGPMAEGPTTPRNDAGPFILDGASGRGNRAENSLVTQAVPEVSEPGSMEDQPRERRHD